MACSSEYLKIYEQYPDGERISLNDDAQDIPDSPLYHAEQWRKITHDAGRGLTQGVIEIGETETIVISGDHRPVIDLVLNQYPAQMKPILSSNTYIRRVDNNRYSMQNVSSPASIEIGGSILTSVLNLSEAPQYLMNILANLLFIEDKNMNSHLLLPFEDELSLKYARFGSHKNGYGGTYRLAEKYPEILHESLNPIAPCTDCLALPLSQVEKVDLSKAMSNRKSSRDHSTPPAALEDILTLLFLSARGELSGAGMRNEPLYRFPYPSGGSLGELRFLVIVNRVTLDGAELGESCFEYHPLSGKTYKHRVNTGELHKLIKLYSHMPGIPPEELQCLILVFADAERVAGKYESVAPALIFKHVGAWMQTAYLVATQLPLSVCALGGGPDNTIQKLFGIEDSSLVPVGEMACARRIINDSDNSFDS